LRNRHVNRNVHGNEKKQTRTLGRSLDIGLQTQTLGHVRKVRYAKENEMGEKTRPKSMVMLVTSGIRILQEKPTRKYLVVLEKTRAGEECALLDGGC